MFSWGTSSHVTFGGYGSVTYDKSREQFVFANQPWTDDRLPYSCSALKALPLPTFPHGTRLGPLYSADGGIDSIEQITWFNKKHPKPYIPRELLKELIEADNASSIDDPPPRHSLLHSFTASDGISYFVHPVGATGSRISFAPIHCEKEDQLTPSVKVDWNGRREFPLSTRLVKVSSDRVNLGIAALTTSCLSIIDIEHPDGPKMHPVFKSKDDEFLDASISHFGRNVLLSTRNGHVYLFNQECQLETSWTLDVLNGVKHVCSVAEHINLASSVNRLMLLDSRVKGVSHDIVVPIGGSPYGVTAGYKHLAPMVFFSGPEKLAAIDLRNPKEPTLQWDNGLCFGAPLCQLSVRHVEGQYLLAGVTDGFEELIIVPVIPEHRLNTISTLSPKMLSSLNANRLYVRFEGKSQIIGLSTIAIPNAFPSDPSAHTVFHMTADGLSSYQHISLSTYFSRVQPETEQDLMLPSDLPKLRDRALIRPLPRGMHPSVDQSQLLYNCFEGQRKSYVEVSDSSQERQVLDSWGIKLKSEKYLPNLHTKVLSPEPVLLHDIVLSSAAHHLNKLWDE